MRVRKDTITGVVALLGSAYMFYMTQQIRQPNNLLEPGPRLMPYVALTLIAISAIALIIKGIKDRAIEEKPYYPKGGVLKVSKSFAILVIYAIAMNYLGFLITTPFATAILIYYLKGKTTVKPIIAVAISFVVTFGLYAMFVYGFQLILPMGEIFR